MHVMLFHCAWRMYQIILWIHSKVTVKIFSLARSIIQFLAMRNCPVAVANVDSSLLKNGFLSFHTTVATHYRWGGQKQKCLLISNFCRIFVPKIIEIGSNFLLSYSRKTGWQFLKKVVYRADHVIYVFWLPIFSLVMTLRIKNKMAF